MPVDVADRPLVWLHGEIRSPPFSTGARVEAGELLRRLQRALAPDAHRGTMVVMNCGSSMRESVGASFITCGSTRS